MIIGTVFINFLRRLSVCQFVSRGFTCEAFYTGGFTGCTGTDFASVSVHLQNNTFILRTELKLSAIWLIKNIVSRRFE